MLEVPVRLDETAEYIKDYIALKAIWTKMDGPNWKYYGESSPMGANWNFNKDIDLWGNQPGVQLLDNGRVALYLLPDSVLKEWYPMKSVNLPN